MTSARAVLLLKVLFFLNSARAVCGGHNGLGNYRDVPAYIQKIAAYGNPNNGDVDHRETEEHYAASHHMDLEELKAKLSATGKLECGGFEGSAQLTLKSHLITTAGHMLTDQKTCKRIASPSQCIFTYKFMGKEFSIQVAGLAASGFKCNPKHKGKKDKERKNEDWDDWAVMKLASPAKGPIPYGIGKEGHQITEKQNVIAVAAQSTDFCIRNSNGKCVIDPSTKGFIRPKHIEDCQSEKVYTDDHDVPNLFSSICATDGGSSGGSILDSSLEQPLLLGITIGEQDSEAERQAALEHGTITMKPFDEKTWATFHIPVAGDFRQAIIDAAK